MIRITFTKRIALVLMALLVIGTLQGSLGLAGIAMTDQQLCKYHGAMEFWKDPCTWDGFAVGAGIILCGLGNVGGCASALIGAVRAVKADNCF